MINKIIHGVVTAIVSFVSAFSKGFTAGFKGEPVPNYGDDELSIKFFDADSDDLPPGLLAALEAAKKNQKGHAIRPLSYHMSKFFDASREPSRSEAIENMALSLESLGKEIASATSPPGTVVCRVEREKELLHGHLDWQFDKHNPDVYTISMDLLRDGFTFRADTKTFVITGKLPE